MGKLGRLREIEARLATPDLLSVEDMKEIALDIARTVQGGIGRPARFLKSYLLAALASVPPQHPLADEAVAVLESWDGSLYADARTSTRLEPGEVLFSRWLDRMLTNTFNDELGGITSPVAVMLLHVLDDALGDGSGVPPSRDYFNGVDPNVVISTSFDQALTSLGSDPAAWSAVPRDTVDFKRAGFSTIPSAGSIPESNRGTYVQIVVLGNPTISAENILTLGQSGFISLGPSGTPVFDAHFDDQLQLYRNFEYKPMHLFRNVR